MPGKGLRHCSAITHAPITSDFCSCKECYCWTSTEFMEKAMFYQWWPCAFTFRGIHFPLVFIKKALCSKGQPAEIHNTIAYTKDIPHSPVLFHVLGWSLRWDTLISVLRCFISSLWFYYSPVWFRTAMGFTLWGGSVAPNPRHQELCVTLHVCSLCVWGSIAILSNVTAALGHALCQCEKLFHPELDAKWSLASSFSIAWREAFWKKEKMWSNP